MRFLLNILIPILMAVTIAFITFNSDLTNSSLKTALYVISALGLLYGLVNWMLWVNRCRECLRWNALVRVSKEETDRKETTITKTFKTKNSKGEVVKTTETPVPATKYFYLVTKKCKYCGDISLYNTTKVEED